MADEINRTTPKTQSALLEAMNESQITVDNHTHPLPQPFLVLATQNPIEHHGTYPLPESQLDRFLMRIRMGYPSRESEKEILRNDRRGQVPSAPTPLMDAADVLAMQEAVSQRERGRQPARLRARNRGRARGRPNSSAWASARAAP